MKRLLPLVPNWRLLACPFTHSGSSARSRVLELAERRTSMLVRMLRSQMPNSAFQRPANRGASLAVGRPLKANVEAVE